MSELAVVYSRASAGVNALPVTVEVHLSNGLPSFSIVGLPEKAVKESKDRVRSALLNAKYDFPVKRITVNLAPADLPKDGGRFDLPIAIGILAASHQLPTNKLADYEFAGELALSGEVRGISGTLPLAMATSQSGRQLICPHPNADEAALVKDLTIFPADHLLQVCRHLTARELISAYQRAPQQNQHTNIKDLRDVKGQQFARRALEIAASGGHSLLFMGPPGTGKTMLASRLPGILPPMTEHEAQQTAAIASISGKQFNPDTWLQRPFRAPHHTASSVALVGGGSPPRPGEISLAHNGVLFLDELPEFNRHVLETLREPLESGHITISRAARQAEFPAQFQLIAAMNPCPCGRLGDPNAVCQCTQEQINRYRTRLSGPLLDRIDMHVEVPSLPKGVLQDTNYQCETSAIVSARVIAIRAIQLQRANIVNAKLENQDIERFCQLSASDRDFLETAMQEFNLSARAYHRILRLARTLADMAGRESIATEDVSEAIGYRRLDRDI